MSTAPTGEGVAPAHVHVLARLAAGHAAAGRWLTGVQEGDRILVDFASPNESLSVDQLVAARTGQETRWPSLQFVILTLNLVGEYPDAAFPPAGAAGEEYASIIDELEDAATAREIACEFPRLLPCLSLAPSFAPNPKQHERLA